jgi:hypothetical protein
MKTPTILVSSLALLLSLLVPAGSDVSAGGVAPYPVGTPLVGPVPAWFTPSLRQQVIAADGMPVAAPAAAPLPGEIGIRPGTWMIAPHGCTMNFVFIRDGVYGIGTAGHCVDAVGQRVILLTLAPGTSSPVLVDIGPVVVRQQNAIDDDFALVAINPVLNSWVDPTAAVMAGPCGAYGGAGPEVVTHYGHGTAIGTGGTPRVGIALIWEPRYFSWDGAASFGDSGSPVRVTGLEAAGVLTALIVNPGGLSVSVAGTRIGRMLEIAAGWSLVNSPLCL